MSGRLAGWFLLGWAGEAPHSPALGRTFVDGGVEGVVVRTGGGSVGAVGRYCRHRNVDLTATATVVDDGVRCRFHGWRTSLDGVVRPCDELGGDAGVTLRSPAWPVVETHGGVWVWLGSKAPGWDLITALRGAVPAGHRVVATRSYDVGTGIERIVENTVDPWHLKYLHGAPGVPELTTHRSGSALLFDLAFADRPPVSGGWLGPGAEYLRFGGDLDLVQTVGLFPEGPARTGYRTQVLAPPGADAAAVADVVAAQFAALDEDVLVWNATGDRVRHALTEPERVHRAELEAWLADPVPHVPQEEEPPWSPSTT